MYHNKLDKITHSMNIRVMLYDPKDLNIDSVPDGSVVSNSLIASQPNLSMAIVKMVGEFSELNKTNVVLCKRLAMVSNLKKQIQNMPYEYSIITGKSSQDERFYSYKVQNIFGSAQIILGRMVGCPKMFDNSIVPFSISSVEFLHILLSKTKENAIFILPDVPSIVESFVSVLKKVVDDYLLEKVNVTIEKINI